MILGLTLAGASFIANLFGNLAIPYGLFYGDDMKTTHRIGLGAAVLTAAFISANLLPATLIVSIPNFLFTAYKWWYYRHQKVKAEDSLRNLGISALATMAFAILVGWTLLSAH